MNFLKFSIFLMVFSFAQAETILYSENFDSYISKSLPKDWWYEGSKAVWLENGHLFADANLDNNGKKFKASTVWLNKEFSGNLAIEVDAHVLKSKGNKNNINFFFLFSDSSGKSLSKTKSSRSDGAYSKYHSSTLNGYIFTFLATENSDIARFRLRDCPGFNLIQENNDYENKKGKTYHIKIIKRNNHIQFFVDGKVYLNAKDNVYNNEHKKGLFGLRTWSTHLWWDNIKVTQLDPI
jgi:hypothetical protein